MTLKGRECNVYGVTCGQSHSCHCYASLWYERSQSKRHCIQSIPEENREEWFLGAVGKMVDVFVHRRLKSDLDKLVREVQEVLDGSTTGTSRKKGGTQPRKRVAANDCGLYRTCDSAGCRSLISVPSPFLH